MRTVNAGKSLEEAIERSNNYTLKTRLITCIAPGDADSIDVQYFGTTEPAGQSMFSMHSEKRAPVAADQAAKNPCYSVRVCSS